MISFRTVSYDNLVYVLCIVFFQSNSDVSTAFDLLQQLESDYFNREEDATMTNYDGSDNEEEKEEGMLPS